MKQRPTAEKAMEAWEELAMFNSRTDYEVNDLLETICKEARTPYCTVEDDPIYYSIKNLTNAGRRQFLKGCVRIRASISEGERALRKGIFF